MSTLPRELQFNHMNYYAFGSCKEVGENDSNLAGALTNLVVNIYKFEDRGSQFRTFRPTLADIVSNTGDIFMPNVDGKMFLIIQGRGMLLSSDDCSTTFLDGIDFSSDLVYVTRDEKIISIESGQKWNLEYGLKCLVWDSNGSKTETSYSELCPHFFSVANLHVEKAFESADEDDLLAQDEWPFYFHTEGSPSIHSIFFDNQPLDIDFAELEIKDVNDNPLVALLNEKDQVWRLKSEVGNFHSSPSGLWKIHGLECRGFIRNLGTDFQEGPHYDLEQKVRQILVLTFLNTRHFYRGGRIDSVLDSKIPLPLRHPSDRPILDLTELNQDD